MHCTQIIPCSTEASECTAPSSGLVKIDLNGDRCLGIGDYNRDLNSKTLKRRGSMNQGKTPWVTLRRAGGWEFELLIWVFRTWI